MVVSSCMLCCVVWSLPCTHTHTAQIHLRSLMDETTAKTQRLTPGYILFFSHTNNKVLNTIHTYLPPEQH